MNPQLKLWIKRLLPLAMPLLVPAIAFAIDDHLNEALEGDAGGAHVPEGEHGEHGWDYTAIGASFFNFFLLISIFVYLFRNSLNNFLKERKASVEEALTEAARLKAEAEAKHREYSQKLASLDSELAQIKADMISAGVKERDRIVAEAEQKAARMRREAEFIVEQHAKQLRADLTKEAAEAAVTAAEALLLKTTTSYDHQRIAQEYLQALGNTKASESKTPSVKPYGTESHA